MGAVSHNLCGEIRVVQVTHGTLNIRDGKTRYGRTETVTQPCNAPLFSDQERATGLCRSCAAGWSVEGNRKATEAEVEAFAAAILQRQMVAAGR